MYIHSVPYEVMLIKISLIGISEGLSLEILALHLRMVLVPEVTKSGFSIWKFEIRLAADLRKENQKKFKAPQKDKISGKRIEAQSRHHG